VYRGGGGDKKSKKYLSGKKSTQLNGKRRTLRINIRGRGGKKQAGWKIIIEGRRKEVPIHHEQDLWAQICECAENDAAKSWGEDT